ncbi:MAG: ATP-binding cassette subfamily C [Gallionellaceae bacterium]|nr:MAG: ATP-binding cassette subfamily C [Gallionellaceae bacterium]
MNKTRSTLNQGNNFLTDENLLRQLFRSPDLRRVLPGLGLSTLLINILGLALPLAILQILDRVVTNQSLETLAFLVLGVVIALVLEEVLRGINGAVTSWLGARFEHNTSVAALERLMHVPLQNYQQDELSKHEERILATTKVSEFYSGQAVLVLFDLPFVVLYPIVIYIIGGWLFAVPVFLLLLFFYLIYRFGNWMREQVRQRTIQDERRLGFLAEVLSGIYSVKTMTMESLMLRRYERLQETNSVLDDALIRGNALASNMGMLFSQIMIVAVVFASSWFVINGKMTPGGLSACMMLSVRALQPLRKGLSVWMRYQSFIAALEKLNQVFAMPYNKDEEKPQMPPLAKELELRNVTLKFKTANSRATRSLARSALYGDVNPNGHKDDSFSNTSSWMEFFSNLPLKLEAGQVIAIQGASGSGKTSLLSLMNGMLQPSSGEILVDGKPLNSYTTCSVYKQIALLPQTGTIVSGTLLENMTMFDASLQDEALRISSKLGLDQIVAGMKLGYETPVGEGVAETLPAGVRQVITIIRALVHKPSVILFDEANISLDMRMDKLLLDYLIEQKGKCSIVLVTHRPSLIKLADKIYSLVDGRLFEGIIETHPDAAISTSVSPAPSSAPERPASSDDLSAVVRRQFDEESDLSICLLPLLKAIEWQGQPRQLADAMPHMARLMDVTVLCSILANLEHFPKHLNGHLASLDSRLMPCLFVPPNKAAMVILKRQSNGNLWAFDSNLRAETEIEPSMELGEIFLFQKSDEPRHSRRMESTWISGILLRFQSHIYLAFVLTLAGALLALAPPLFVRATLDMVLPSGDIVMGAFIMFGVVVAIAADGLLRNLKSKILAFVGGRFEYILGNTLFKRIISLPATSTDGATVSNQVGRFKNLESLRDFFLGPAALLAFELPSTLVLLLAIAVINSWVLLVMLTSIVFFTLLWFFTRKPSEISVAKSGMLSTARWEFLSETLTDMSAIRSVGADKSWTNRFRELSGKSVMANFKNNQLQARINGMAQILTSTTGLMALALSAYLVIRGQISNGTMVATMMILWRVNGPMQNIFLSATAIIHIRSTIRQVENLMRIKGESESGVLQTISPVEGGTLSFARVSFRYANDADPVLLGVSFTVPPGQVIVIAGGNGSGKSTLLKLIERIYVPQAGTIRVNNVDIRQLAAADLRAKISYMPQQCELFYGTVAQNLRLAHPTASDAELNWATKMAGLAEDIAALAQGFNTRISNDNSSQLSNGFRQRLSLARAMLKPADIVLLDEPGTGMDQSGEQALVRCVEWLRGRSSVIMVSHCRS